jgi:LPS export ABC transporter protein LptC
MINRKRLVKRILTAAVILGIAAMVAVFFQFRSRQLVPIPMPDIATKALMTLANLHQTATKNGKIQWELDAESAQMEADSGRMLLTKPKVVFFADDGTQVLLTANSGTLDTRSNDMQVTGNVSVHNDRYTLVTEALVYQHAQRLLRSDVPVKITNKAFDLRADKMTYSLDDNLAQFDGQVEGNLNEDLAL